MSVTVIRNGRVLDPESQMDQIADVCIVDGKITEIGINVDIDKYSQDTAKEIDATGCLVFPGFIDLHVHFREPGFDHKENIRTGSRAAVRGGYTSVCMMPNTKPTIDSKEIVEHVINRVKTSTHLKAYPIGAITANEDGEYLTDFKTLKESGVVAVSEDGKSVMNARVARQAFRLAALSDVPVFAHCEDIYLRANGVMNAGPRAKALGLYGILNEVEDIIVARDIILAKDTGARLHLCHCSTRDSVKLISFAKKGGLPITAEVTPHHLTLTEMDVDGTDSNYKMNPPLRSEDDKEALIRGLKEGIIDCIATDHAPHTEEEKAVGFKSAPFGIVGLETAVPIIYTELVKTGVLTPLEMAEKMSYNPAKIMGSDAGRIKVGAPGDITIVDPNAQFTIRKELFLSKGKNTPYDGREVYGKVRTTIIDGMVVYSKEGHTEIIIDKEVRNF